MTVQRFSFLDFGDELGPRVANAKVFLPTGRNKEEAPPPPPPPTFDEGQLKAAEREAYKKGFLDGQADGRKQAESEQAEINRQLLAVSERFAQSLTPLFNDYRQLALFLQAQMPKVALAIARKVAGASLEQNAQAAIDEVAIRACETMIAEPKLAITVNDKVGDVLEKRLREVAPRLPAATDIVIQRDPAMPATDCRVEWMHGSMERRTELLWQQVEKAINNMAVANERDAKIQMEQLRAQLPLSDETPSNKE